MSEKMYVLLLRLYPSHFRETYGKEAIQLFRDRARDEQGLFLRLRLCFDLLADLLATLFLEYRHHQPAFAGGSPPPRCDGEPSFYLLEGGSPRFGALLVGGLLSFATLTAFPSLLNHAGRNEAKRTSDIRSRTPAVIQPSPFDRPVAMLPEDAKEEALASGRHQPPVQRSKAQYAVGTSAHIANGNPDADERHRVLDQVAVNLKQYYFDREVAQKTADALLAHERSGDDNAVTGGEAFAGLLTRQMRDASHDMHLIVEYSSNTLPEHPQEPTPESLALFRKRMEQENCMFRKVEILPHNIGYVKLDFFPDTSVCESKATSAMAALNHADAIIFDLRDNTGGFPEMVSLIASYLFDHPEYMYSPRGAPTEDSWTRSPVLGNRLADKPVYVLTSSSTWSGAEQFSYDLKMLKRATLVGETTRGGAHAGVFHRIDDHFGMGVPEEKAINPFGKADWEGTGVQPDVSVKAADALQTAMKLAEGGLRKKE
jgi:hypothetical protein